MMPENSAVKIIRPSGAEIECEQCDGVNWIATGVEKGVTTFECCKCGRAIAPLFTIKVERIV